MADSKCAPVVVEGAWSPAQTKNLKNKLQLYFQSKKRSGGGECRVETADGAPTATVFFSSEEVRERVLSRKNHEIIMDNQTIKLRLISAPSSASSDDVSASHDLQHLRRSSREFQPPNFSLTDLKKSEAERGNEASAKSKDASKSVQGYTVVLDNVVDNMPKDMLSLLVENMSGLGDSSYSLEIIWETNNAVITFNSPADAERFLAMSPASEKLQRHGLSARPLEATRSIRVESLPPTMIEDTLELYFENWAPPDKIVMITDEQAAIVTFSDPTVVKNICVKRDYAIKSTPIKVYPYYHSLGTALYGKDRPTWKLPDAFTERVSQAIWKFLLSNKLSKSINDQMQQYFCSVNMDSPDVKLSPLPSFLRQKGLTAQQVDMWMSKAQVAFRQLMSQYMAFECKVNASAWKAAEDDIRSVVSGDAILVMDVSREILTVAGRADRIKQIRDRVENIVSKAMNSIQRQKNVVSEVLDLSSAMFLILQQEGLHKAAQDISPEMNISYKDDTQKFTITGLPAEVYKTKAWILEKKMGMRKRQIELHPAILDFLRTMDPMDMSLDLFISKGTGAFYTIENRDVLLSGTSDGVLADAESNMKAALSSQTVNVEDQEVLRLKIWVDLKQQLFQNYNSLKKTVDIQIHPERRDQIMVTGFLDPVHKVCRILKEFIVNNSRVQETIRVESCTIVEFIAMKKQQVWSRIVEDNNVTICFDENRPKVFIAGARLHVQKATSCVQELINSLFTDTLIVDKPGAKKYFLSYGRPVLSSLMSELNCVVMVRPEDREENDEEECVCSCKVKTAGGVLVSVSRADMCRLSVNAVVNAANESLQHIGGLALALLKAAGPELQKISDDFIAKNGNLRTGDAIVTGACNLPCKHVIHTVGPRFLDHDKKTSVSLLKLAVQQSLTQAVKLNCSTIALPAISSGEYGFPLDLCANTIAEAVREFCDSPQSPGCLKEILLVANNDHTVRALTAAVDTVFSDLGPSRMPPQEATTRGAGASGYQQGHDRSQSTRGRHFGAEGGNQQERQTGWGASGEQSRTTRSRSKGQERVEQTTDEGVRIVLSKGNIQDQTTCVIVNTISDSLNLNMGAVSIAILQAAGQGLQLAVLSEAKGATLPYGNVVITNSFNLRCKKVFHAVCPSWQNGAGQADLTTIITYCLEQAEKLQMRSVSFPAIGTGALGFPRDVVSRVLLREIRSFSRRRTPRHLRDVVIVVHPSDKQTEDCFTREFGAQSTQRNSQQDTQEFPPAAEQSVSQPQQSSASSISQVLSTSLGVYRMQMGQLIFEVSSGDITKESCDVIINSSNGDFTLKSGVSKAILDGAGPSVETECRRIVNSAGYQPQPMILTLAGQLPSRHILHIFIQNDPAKIKNMVYSVLKFCEDNKFKSVAFPALGTGRGRVSPSSVADAMVDAVVDFVRKKQPKFVCIVKIMIFQPLMLTAFHKSMKKNEGKQVEEKGLLTKVKDVVTGTFTSMFGLGKEQPSTDGLVFEKLEFEPTVFEMCADNAKAVRQAKTRIRDLIVAEQAERSIKVPGFSQLTQADLDELMDVQKKLMVNIRLDKGQEDQEPIIHLDGLTREVFNAEAAVRSILQRMEKKENMTSKALLVSKLAEWQFELPGSQKVAFDIDTNLCLEEALERKQSEVKIKIKNETFYADVILRQAVSMNGLKVGLHRTDKKSTLPSNWSDMQGSLFKLDPLAVGSTEYNDVERQTNRTGLTANIISIERVQNATLWQSYQLMKNQLEVKNNHTNNERQLFHGTGPDSIDRINQRGFNRSYAGTHGALYGNGTYFAVDPNYSGQHYAKPDASGHKRMYLARVLVGEFTQGKGGLITPPNKGSGRDTDLYDSVTDKTANPTMFVVFGDNDAYPEYLITFM